MNAEKGPAGSDIEKGGKQHDASKVTEGRRRSLLDDFGDMLDKAFREDDEAARQYDDNPQSGLDTFSDMLDKAFREDDEAARNRRQIEGGRPIDLGGMRCGDGMAELDHYFNSLNKRNPRPGTDQSAVDAHIGSRGDVFDVLNDEEERS